MPGLLSPKFIDVMQNMTLGFMLQRQNNSRIHSLETLHKGEYGNTPRESKDKFVNISDKEAFRDLYTETSRTCATIMKYTGYIHQ